MSPFTLLKQQLIFFIQFKLKPLRPWWLIGVSDEADLCTMKQPGNNTTPPTYVTHVFTQV